MESISTDVVIVGAGPAGIFAALSLLEAENSPRILMVEKGLAIEDRSCPKHKVGHCVECDPCRITTGFSGAGAFSDGKLSLSCEVGGDLPELIGAEAAQETIEAVDGMYLQFGADEHVEGVGEKNEVKEIRRRAIQAGLKLVDCPIRHLGTEKAQEIYGRIEHYLVDAGVEIRFQCECHQVLVEDEVCQGIVIEQAGTTTAIHADHTIIATGRRGADWLERMCREHHIAHGPGPVDIGVRVEVRNEVMETVNNVLYESKLIGYPK
ncbi:MAG: FAD-binding protein, partial [Raoultibacter sp.]